MNEVQEIFAKSLELAILIKGNPLSPYNSNGVEAVLAEYLPLASAIEKYIKEITP